VRDFDVAGFEARRVKPGVDRVAERVEDLLAVARPVLRKIALPAAENVDLRCHANSSCSAAI
jgi:hypothetical protein